MKSLPANIYIGDHPGVSAAAIKRGQTGFLYPRRDYQVRFKGKLIYRGPSKKEAWRAARSKMWKRGRARGISLTIDGIKVRNNVIASNLHPPLESELHPQ
jgi:hypothetical protein